MFVKVGRPLITWFSTSSGLTTCTFFVLQFEALWLLWNASSRSDRFCESAEVKGICHALAIFRHQQKKATVFPLLEAVQFLSSSVLAVGCVAIVAA